MTQYESLRFDGFSVDHFAGQFAGTFDMEENYEMDQEISFVVVAKVTGAGITNTKLGDLKRTNKFEVMEVSVTGSGSTSRNRAAMAQIAGQLSMDDDDETLEELEAAFEEGEIVDVFTPPSSSVGPRSVRDKALASFLEP